MIAARHRFNTRSSNATTNGSAALSRCSWRITLSTAAAICLESGMAKTRRWFRYVDRLGSDVMTAGNVAAANVTERPGRRVYSLDRCFGSKTIVWAGSTSQNVEHACRRGANH